LNADAFLLKARASKAFAVELREDALGRPSVPLNLNGMRGGDPVRPL